MRWLGGKPAEPAWVYGLAGALMLGGPVWREMYVNSYPTRPEIIVLPLVGVIVGALVALSSRLVGGLAGTVIFGGLLFVFADLQFDLERYTYTAAILAACLVVAAMLASHRAAIMAMALAAFYLSSLLRTSPLRISAGTPVQSSGPLLVHIILDEQWGIGGLRAVGDSATADFLTAFYMDRGFEVYESAYSRYELTLQSVPTMVALRQEPSFLPSKPTPPGGPYWSSMRHAPYFERLRDLGYDLRVFQSTFVDFCHSVEVPVVDCDVQSGNSIANNGFVGGSWVDRGLWTMRFFLNTRSHVYAKLIRDSETWRRSVAGGGIAAMQRSASAIAAGHPKATAYFIHALLPHHPVQMDAECRLLSDAARRIADDRDQRDDSRWRTSVSVYGGQVRCAHRMIGQVIDAIDSTVGRDRSIVIVHGDHGSRMGPRTLALEKYSVDQLNSMFSTLLAVRRPHAPAARYQYPVPVQDAIWELAGSGFASSLPAEWRHEVRSVPDKGRETIRQLTPAEMLWARRAN